MAELNRETLLEKIAQARIALRELCIPHEENCIVNVEDASLSKEELLEKITQVRNALRLMLIPHEASCIVNIERTFSPCDCGAEQKNKPITSVITILYPEE